MKRCVTKASRTLLTSVLSSTLLLTSLLTTSGVWANPQAIEIGAGNTADLPGGREADGIIGDFVLRNDKIEAVISGNQHNRKANMVVMWDVPTPGCLYDLTPRDTNNDQITAFRPGHQQGRLSSVGVLKSGADGQAIVRATLTPAAAGGLGRTHDYLLRDGWDYVIVVSTYENTTDQPIKVHTAPHWIGLESGVMVGNFATALCQDPTDRIGYAFRPIAWNDAQPTQSELEIPAGQIQRYAVALAVGAGPADAFGIAATIGETAHVISGRIMDTAGQPATTATLHVASGDKTCVAFVDDDGRFNLAMPNSTYNITVKDLGRPDHAAELLAGEPLEITLPLASSVAVEINDAEGNPLPCKLQFIGEGTTETPHLGPVIRAHGCDNEYYTETGRFTQPMPTGQYRVVITRGIEYDHVERMIEVQPETTTRLQATLHRIVDTTGWISSDFHNHSTPSGDNYCGTDDRIINLAAEHIEFAPATEHNRIYPWTPHIEKLGLTRHIKSIIGTELTGSGPHLNSFPLQPQFHHQDNGAPQWKKDPRINAITLRRMPGDSNSRWVHLNHPDVPATFKHLHPDAHPIDGFPQLEALLDGAEMWGEHILGGESAFQREWDGKMVQIQSRPFYWLQLLNAGHFIRMVAVSDAHEVAQGGVGGWRTYLPSSTDEPADINVQEVIDHAKAGHSFVTNGPFLEVATEAGAQPGDTVSATESIVLNVRVQCNTWVDVDRVVVLANGKPRPELDFHRDTHPEMFSDDTVRFEQKLNVPLYGDTHLIVVVHGDGSTLKTGYGQSWQSQMHPVAYHNPIFVDTDGNGFTPNGDTLGGEFLPAYEYE